MTEAPPKTKMKNEEARKLGQQSEEQHHKQAELDFSQSFFLRETKLKRERKKEK